MTSARSVFLFCVILSLGIAASSEDYGNYDWSYKPTSKDDNSLPSGSQDVPIYRPPSADDYKNYLKLGHTFEADNSLPQGSQYVPNVHQRGRQLIGTMGQSHRDIYTPTDVEVKAMTSDAHYWYLKGIDNAEHGATRFDAIAESLKKDKNIENLLTSELTSLLDQVSDANDNNISTVSNSLKLISYLYEWTRNPGWFDKMKIKSTIWYVKDKRDNKSYYLLNGAAFWIDLRVKMLNSIRTEAAKTLRDDLNRCKNKIVTARDTLNNAAQVYFRGLNQLVTLTEDIGANLEMIQTLVETLQAMQKSRKEEILQTSQDAVNCIKEIINKYH